MGFLSSWRKQWRMPEICLRMMADHEKRRKISLNETLDSPE
jgi:hypothetical protein